MINDIARFASKLALLLVLLGLASEVNAQTARKKKISIDAIADAGPAPAATQVPTVTPPPGPCVPAIVPSCDGIQCGNVDDPLDPDDSCDQGVDFEEVREYLQKCCITGLSANPTTELAQISCFYVNLPSMCTCPRDPENGMTEAQIQHCLAQH